jgi:hypothetical protein
LHIANHLGALIEFKGHRAEIVGKAAKC